VEACEDDGSVGLREVENRIGKTPNRRASNLASGSRVVLRVGLNRGKSFLDRLEESLAQASPSLFVPDKGLLHLGAGDGAKGETERHAPDSLILLRASAQGSPGF
jgi:hypothetical protein